MSRKIVARWELTGVLVAQSPVHVGDADGSPRHLSVLRDGLDRPLLPGTSLAGVIHNALGLSKRYSENHLWKPVLEPGNGDRDSDHVGGDYPTEASWVWLDDAPAAADTPTETRDHVAIDRRTGAAARGFLYSQEVLPAGTRFTFRMVVDDGGEPTAGQLVKDVAALLCGPGVSVGAAVTRGMGRVRLQEARLRRWEFATRKGILATLRGQATDVPLPPAAPDDPPNDVLRIVIPWRPAGPLAVQVAAEGDVVDAFPLTTNDSGGVRLELPGSTIKGVLRSHAERIARTLTQTRAPEDLLDQMRADGLGPVAALFGTANAGRAATGRTRRGALTVNTCLTDTMLPTERWRAVRIPGPAGSSADTDAELARTQKAVDELNEAVDGLWFTVAHHVAIDRWTGGAADGRLFAVLEAHATSANTWRPIILDLDVCWLPDDQRQPALALLLLVLRDLCDGWIGFGHATTRGMGGVVVDPAAIRLRSGVDKTFPYPLDGRSLADVLDDPQTTQYLAEVWATAMSGGGT